MTHHRNELFERIDAAHFVVGLLVLVTVGCSGSDWKDHVFARETMEVMNRWFVMTRILGRRHPGWWLRFAFYQLLMLLLLLRQPSRWSHFPAATAGKLAGAWKIAIHSREWKGYPS